MARFVTSPERPGPMRRVLRWMQRQVSPGNGLADYSQAELGHMAEDLGVTRADMLAMAEHGRDNTALMEGMMQAHGLEPAAIREGFPVLLRDMQRVCTQCRDAKRCRRELAAGTASEHARGFCPNHATLADLGDYTMGR